MTYSSSLTDPEWEIVEPLLLELLPTKKQTRPPDWTKREILDGIFYQLKNGCNWGDLPKDLPPYSTVYWYYNSHSALQFVVGKKYGPECTFYLGSATRKRHFIVRQNTVISNYYH